MIRLTVFGARGRMGSCICRLARASSQYEIVARIDRDDDGSSAARADVIVDFSSPEGAATAAALAVRQGAALLVGTTGLSPRILDVMDDAADRVPVMIAPNTSRAVAVLDHLAVEAARLLGTGFEVSIEETHHAGKRDAPSGTALRIAASLRNRASVDLPPERIASIREGTVTGRHVVDFKCEGEHLTLGHAAADRSIFARGAMDAAAWLAEQDPGRYAIEDSLGF